MNAATKEGTYQLEVEASQGNETIGTYKTAFQVKDRPVEFYDAALDAGNLRNIATQTGGPLLSAGRHGDIPEDAIYIDAITPLSSRRNCGTFRFCS